MKAGLAVLAFVICLSMTGQANHIRLAFLALPATDRLLIFALGWALVAVIPSLVAILVPARTWTGAVLTGAIISFLSLLCLTPYYLGLIALLSLE